MSAYDAFYVLARQLVFRVSKPDDKHVNANGGSFRRQSVHGVPDLIDISFQGMDRAAYEQTMVRLDFDETRDRIVRFIELQKEMSASSPEIRINMVRTALIEPSIDHARRF